MPLSCRQDKLSPLGLFRGSAAGFVLHFVPESQEFQWSFKANAIPLRRQGICIAHIANYQHDWLICSPTEQQARSNTKVVLAHLQKLGLTLNSKKSCLTSTSVVTFLGLSLNSTLMREPLISPQRQSVFKECLSEFLKKEQVTVRLGRRLLSLMAAVSQGVPLGLLHMRPLQQWLAKYKVSLY